MRFIKRILKTVLPVKIQDALRDIYDGRRRFIKKIERKFNGKPLSRTIQIEIQEMMKKHRCIYFHNEKKARELADTWQGEIIKPWNLRIIENAVPVVLFSSNEYAHYMAVLLQSMMDYSNPRRIYHFIILGRSFSYNTKNCLMNQVLKFPHCKIDFFSFENVFYDILIRPSKSIPVIDMYSKLFIPYWFNEYPKVIYCDCDMIAKGDIAQLYDLDIQGYCMGATVDSAAISNIKNLMYSYFAELPIFLFLDNWSRYISDGVLVFDTKKFKEKVSYQDCFKLAIYYTNRYKDHAFDKDIISMLVKDDYFILPEDWNYTWSVPKKDGKYGFRPPKFSTKLFHFNSSAKPWKDFPDTVKNVDALAYMEYASSVELFEKREADIKYLEVHLAEHCNLNCAYCSHNCPIAESEFPNLQQFEKDFIKLSQLTNGYIGYVKLIGGEPLLNPDVVRIMQIVRQNIPYGTIKIITNGILLTQMKEDFWAACKKNDISILISQYPIKLKMEKIVETAEKYRVNVLHETSLYRNHRNDIFISQKLDINGKRDINRTFKNCMGHNCTFLKEGKIYLCPTIPCSIHLENRFGVKFSISEDDFLFLDRINNVQEVLNFISHPSPFCRYCATENSEVVKWRISEGKMNEWILKNKIF